MVSKILGYIVSGLGIAITAVGTLPALKKAIKVVPENFSDMYIMGIGLLIVVLGVLILVKNPSSNKVSEVPIYQGKEVVGFRRIGKK